MTSVKQCARAPYVVIYGFLSISTTDVTTCDATDAFCALVWPQPYIRGCLEAVSSVCNQAALHSVVTLEPLIAVRSQNITTFPKLSKTDNS
jgi:hypothetical protein